MSENLDLQSQLDDTIERMNNTRQDLTDARKSHNATIGMCAMSSLHNVNKQLSFFKNVNKQLSIFKYVKKQLPF